MSRAHLDRSIEATLKGMGVKWLRTVESYDVDAMRAFEMLRELSQTSNTRLVDIADRVIATRGA